jgi:hypothetical protein
VVLIFTPVFKVSAETVEKLLFFIFFFFYFSLQKLQLLLIIPFSDNLVSYRAIL